MAATGAACGSRMSIRAARFKIMASVDERGPRPVLPLAHGDPSVFPAFRTAAEAEDAVADALRTGEFNCYPAGVSLPDARRAVSDYLSRDLPYSLSSSDVFLTTGGTQAIEAVISVLSQQPGPTSCSRGPASACRGTGSRPGALRVSEPALHEARAAFCGLEVRHFDLVPEMGWEVDVDSLEAVADRNTTAVVLINPNNPCGSVYGYRHLERVAEEARGAGRRRRGVG